MGHPRFQLIFAISFAHFSYWVVSLFLTVSNSSCSSFIGYICCKYLITVCGLSFSYTVSFDEQKFLVLMQLKLFIFLFMIFMVFFCLFLVHLKTLSLLRSHTDIRFFQLELTHICCEKRFFFPTWKLSTVY